MNPILHILDALPYFVQPSIPLGWLGLLALAVLTIWLVIKGRNFQPVDKPKSRWLLPALVLAVPLTSLLGGLQLPGVATLMILAALPWMLGGGLLGPVTGALLGAFSGLLIGSWITHSPFTPLEFALLGTLFSMMTRQRYRTAFFRFLRQPVAAAFILIPTYLIIFIVGIFLFKTELLTQQISSGLISLWPDPVAVAGELLISGIICQILVIIFPKLWNQDTPVQPSPSERSLETRWLYWIGTLIVLLLFALLIGNWIIIEHTVHAMMDIPDSEIHQIILAIAVPLSLMILALTVTTLLALKFSLRNISKSLQTLANEATLIAEGKFDQPLDISSSDELGQLRQAFEQMRSSLQARLNELNRLLAVSQGVASSFDIYDAIQPILAAILANGASAVRVVLSPSALPDSTRAAVPHFGLGEKQEVYAWLDEQILIVTQREDRAIMTDMKEMPGFEIDTGKPRPGALLALTLRNETRYFGALWAAYDQPRQFTESEVRFISTLAGQAALAASNNYLFQTAEVGRRQLEAILASTPDPVLVTDQHNRLLLANPAAWRTLGQQVKDGKTKPIDKILRDSALLDLLEASTTEHLSAEVELPDERTYLATASSVVAEGRLVGRVCILRDVTHFKELDQLKSEFVSTVSHDLRSPLTLMRGYATMLEMAGPINEQQKNYVGKILTGVENMARLVNDLLDLGRIEFGVGLNLADVPIMDIIDRVLIPLQTQAAGKNIQLDLQLPRELPQSVEADSALLYQAVYNLVENAIKYTDENGSVTLAVQADLQNILFEIHDTGIGILEEDRPHMFSKFFRGTHRKAHTRTGSGLGLAIVRSIAEKHHGRVWLTSKVNEGSTFFLQVPLVQPK